MARLADILEFGWPGQGWSCVNHPVLADAYATLNWSGPAAKPTLAEVQAQETATDDHLALIARRKRQAISLFSSIDGMAAKSERIALMMALDTILDGLVEVATKVQLRAGQSYDQAVINRVQALRQKIQDAKQVL